MINPMNLSGKTILITGASDGIGKATAILASQLGASIVMVARSEEKLQHAMNELEGNNHSWYSYNLKEIEGIEKFVKRIIDANGPLDGFVHCAGISGMRPLKMTNYNFLHEIMLVNFYSFVELCRCISKKGNYLKNMSIIGMSSISSITGYKSKTAYCASKAAMDGAIRAMAKECGNNKIRINSIKAGFVRTKMFERHKEKSGKYDNNDDFDDYYLGIGEPIDVANAIVFLLSDCSRIITGTGWVIDSGVTA